ncbi:ferrochelatase [Limnochorda pilosa]|uniref:Coproporphyrin III ferrochelatase n=1 Tax=Limnochorda pilosa TaxID=1555112 RepID=A0A0K2SHJ6_LIMPI|nr:ferrochelatase [Limnochorda pilosa]BAS26565.1 ferrochelatase [Limnochorda pilosa]
MDAVLLMAFGGPESLEEIPGFLRSLMGRTPPPRVEHEVIERYHRLGGRSPLPEVTRRQAEALAGELARRGRPLRVYVGMQHARPTIGEAFDRMETDGVTRLVAVSLAPYRAQASTQAYEERVQREVAERGSGMEVRFPGDWYLHPRYVEALAQRLEEAWSHLSPPERAQVPVIFSAHSLPVRFVEQGDPYVEQLEQTASAIAERLAGVPFPWELAFQSQGQASTEPWLGPAVEEVMDRLHAQGHRRVVVDPIGFVTDHLETLYDNDVLHREHAARLGLDFIRVRCPNLQPRFIEALADLVLETAGWAA